MLFLFVQSDSTLPNFLNSIKIIPHRTPKRTPFRDQKDSALLFQAEPTWIRKRDTDDLRSLSITSVHRVQAFFPVTQTKIPLMSPKR